MAHRAPGGRLVIATDAAWRITLAALCAAAAGFLCFWAAATAGVATAWALAATVGAVAAAAAASWRWGRSHTGVLMWAAHQWHFAPEGSAGPPLAGTLDLMIDLDTWMLLRFKACETSLPARWLPVSRNRHRSAWQALRAAVYTHAARVPDASEPRG